MKVTIYDVEDLGTTGRKVSLSFEDHVDRIVIVIDEYEYAVDRAELYRAVRAVCNE